MSPEQSPHNNPENQWDIAVACDVSLAQIFKNNPTLPRGSTIHIDPTAIAQALTTINPDVSGKLLFVATHDESLNQSSENSTFTLGIAMRHRRHGEHKVKVVVAGGLSAILDINTMHALHVGSELSQKNDYDESSRKNVETRAQKIKLVERLMAIGRLSPSATQETAIHELTHAVDFEDPIATKRDRKYLRRTSAIGSTAAAGTIFVTSNLVGISANAFTNSLPELITASLIGSLVGLVGFKRVVDPRLRKRQYHNSPAEIRANANEKLAPQLPPIITFVTPE